MAHTYSYADGAEKQTLLGWVNTPTAVIDTSIKQKGAASFDKNGDVAGFTFRNAGLTGGQWAAQHATNVAWATCYLYIDTLPDGGLFNYLAASQGATLARSWARLTSDGTIGLGFEATLDNTPTGTLAVGTWYIMSVLFTRSGADTMTFIIRSMAGATIISGTVADSGGAELNFNLGFRANAASNGRIHLDEIVIETGAAASIDDPYNDLGVSFGEHVMVPTAAGNSNNFTSGTFADVDEIPNNGGTDFLSATADGSLRKATFTTQNLGSGAGASPHIIKILLDSAVMLCVTNGRVASPLLLSGGTEYDVGAGGAQIGTGAYEMRSGVYVLDPFDSAAWTAAKVNALEVGASNLTAGAPSTLRVTATYLSVFGTISALSQQVIWYH